MRGFVLSSPTSGNAASLAAGGSTGAIPAGAACTTVRITDANFADGGIAAARTTCRPSWTVVRGDCKRCSRKATNNRKTKEHFLEHFNFSKLKCETKNIRFSLKFILAIRSK